MQQQNGHTHGTRLILAGSLLAGLATLALTGCSLLMPTGAERPPEAEFGLGPRTSTQGLYRATLQPVQALRTRRTQTVKVQLTDSTGTPLADAAITVEGGMPEHGHGLPTRPKVTGYAGDGVYEIEGVRFSMGGWWEFSLAVSTPAGSDVVTFNIDL